MKKTILPLALILVVLVAGCGPDKEMQAEVEQLRQLAQQKDADIDGFITSLTNIQSNLDSIKALEGIVTAKAIGESGQNATAEDDILSDMRAIYEKMRKNKEQVKELERRLKDSSIGSEKLNQLIAKLKADMSAKDAEIAVLRDKLAKADIYIDELMADIDQLALEGEQKGEVIQAQDRMLSVKEKELRTAYWVKGGKKELMERNIIDREGAFLGIGGVKKVSGDVTLEDLDRVDIYEVTEFAVGAKKAEVVSAHPKHTYEVVGDKTAEKLVVTDPDAFWSKSKVLVIVTN